MSVSSIIKLGVTHPVACGKTYYIYIIFNNINICFLKNELVGLVTHIITVMIIHVNVDID